MKIGKAIEILKSHNRWRRGEDVEQMHPMLIGAAIDTVVSYIENTPQFSHKFQDIIDDIETKLTKK